jgi:hypothetical protein
MTVAHLKERMDARFNAVDRRFNAVAKRFDALDKKLDAHLAAPQFCSNITIGSWTNITNASKSSQTGVDPRETSDRRRAVAQRRRDRREFYRLLAPRRRALAV